MGSVGFGVLQVCPLKVLKEVLWLCCLQRPTPGPFHPVGTAAAFARAWGTDSRAARGRQQWQNYSDGNLASSGHKVQGEARKMRSTTTFL